jgi:hypothetical protein
MLIVGFHLSEPTIIGGSPGGEERVEKYKQVRCIPVGSGYERIQYVSRALLPS